MLECVRRSSNPCIDTRTFGVIFSLAGTDIRGVQDMLVHRSIRSSLDHDARERVVDQVLANVLVDDERWNANGLERFERANALHYS